MSWHNIADGLPPMDTPVWIDSDEWQFGPVLAERCAPGDADGWLWARIYGGVWFDRALGRWEADDTETDDDYQPQRWHALPEVRR